jgi:Tfp pilus assembly protein PilV
MRRTRRSLTRRRGLSFVELLIAMALSALVAVGTVAMTIIVAKQTRANISNELALRQASHVLDFMAQHLRAASADSALNYAFATEIETGVYDSVRFEEDGEIAEFRLQQLEGENPTVIYDPNVSIDEDEQTLADLGEPMPRFTELRFIQNQFFPAGFDESGNPIGTGEPDNSTLTIQLTVSDEGDMRTWTSDESRVSEFTLQTYLTLRAPG